MAASVRGYDSKAKRSPPLAHLAYVDISSCSQSIASGPSSSGNSNVSHHLLPASISPTMDLALLFSTTAPSASAAATSGQPGAGAGPASANHAGLSAAQKLIQQRIAMMKARAAAAAGLKSSPATDSPGSVDAEGPLRGTPIEISLWRVGNGTEIVWKRYLTLPDVVLEGTSVAKDREVNSFEHAAIPRDSRSQQTTEVLGMQWSPDGQRLAIHAAVSRQPGCFVTMLVLYSIHDGQIQHVVPLGRCSALRENVPQAMSMDWSNTGLRAEVCRRQSLRPSRWYAELPSVSAFVAAQHAQSSGSTAGGRFHHLVGVRNSAGTGQANTTNRFLLPSQRGLESDTCAEKSGSEDPELGDFLRDWMALSINDDQESEPLTLLLVPGWDIVDDVDGVSRQGVHILMHGKVPIAFVPLPRSNSEPNSPTPSLLLWAKSLQRGEIFLSGLQQHNAAYQLCLGSITLPCLCPASREAEVLMSLVDVTSVIRFHTLTALDQAYTLVAIYKTLSAPSLDRKTSLSTHQAMALPPLRRFQHTLQELANNHVQSIKAGLVTSLASGVHSDMMESLLLNSLSESKWRTMRESIVRIYEVAEFVAGELVVTLGALTRHLEELRGFAHWTKAAFPLLPDEMEGLSLAAFVEKLVLLLVSLSVTTHHAIHYSQAERLAWAEMDSWIQWERDRLDSLKTDKADPMDPKTFDPLVIMELVLRNFECKELDWLLLGQRAGHPGAGAMLDDPSNDDDDDAVDVSGAQFSEASFDGVVREQRAAILPQQGEPRERDEFASMANVESIGGDALGTSGRRQTSASHQLESTLQWLRDERNSGPAPTGVIAGLPKLRVGPRDDLQRLFQSGIVPGDDGHPSVYLNEPLFDQVRIVATSLKAIFTGLPQRMQNHIQYGGCVEVSLPNEAGWVEILDSTTDEYSLPDRVVSLSVPISTREEDSGQATDLQQRQSLQRRARSILIEESDVGDGSSKPRCVQVLTAFMGSAAILLIWQTVSSSTADHSHWLLLRVAGAVQSVEIFDSSKLLVVSHSGAHQAEARFLDISVLRSLASPLSLHTTREPLTILEAQQWAQAGALVYAQPLGHGERVNVALSAGRNMVGVLLRGEVRDRPASSPSGTRVDFWDVVGDVQNAGTDV